MNPIIFFYIPVYNEQDTIGVLLYRIREVMRKSKLEYKVIIVLDGCTDNSAEVIEPYVKIMPIKVVENERREGYAKSLFRAIKLADEESQNPKRDFFLTLEADFTQDPIIVDEMMEHIQRNVDMYVGSRLGSEGSIKIVRKRVATRLLYAIFGSNDNLVPEPDTDYFCTLRGFRINLLRRRMQEIEMLRDFGPSVSPAFVSYFMYLLYRGLSRKFMTARYREKYIRKRGSRFSVVTLFRSILNSRFRKMDFELDNLVEAFVPDEPQAKSDQQSKPQSQQPRQPQQQQPRQHQQQQKPEGNVRKPRPRRRKNNRNKSRRDSSKPSNTN